MPELEAYEWSPVELQIYMVARSVSSSWQPVSQEDVNDDSVLDAALYALSGLGVVELCIEAEMQSPGCSEIVTATHHLSGVLEDPPKAMKEADIQAAIMAGWEDRDKIRTTRKVTHIRLCADWAGIENASANRHAEAVGMVELVREGRGIQGYCYPVDVDCWMPAAWFSREHDLKPTTLRQAAFQDKLPTREGRSKLYSLKHAKQLWPFIK